MTIPHHFRSFRWNILSMYFLWRGGRDSRWVNYLRVMCLLHASCKMTAPQASATSISLRSDYDYGSIISKAAPSLSYSELNMKKFVTGNDVFISLPTGFGKSLGASTLAG